MKAYRLDLLYKWSSGRGFILTPKSKIKWEESYITDLKSVSEGENYLLVTLFYSVDSKGRVSDRGYLLTSNFKSDEISDELRKMLKTSWIDYADSPDSLNYRIAAILSIFTKIKEWAFSEKS